MHITLTHLLLWCLFIALFLLGWYAASRRPWDHKLNGWKLDPMVRRARYQHNYWPVPEYAVLDWERPHNHAYCIRCGKWPFQGPELMYSRTSGIMFICHFCSHRTQTTFEELVRYAHMIVDIGICQNFDPRFTPPDQAEPITHFWEMWRGLLNALADLEATRG